MLGCTPYSDDENKVEMKSPDEIDAYYDYLGEMQEAYNDDEGQSK